MNAVSGLSRGKAGIHVANQGATLSGTLTEAMVTKAVHYSPAHGTTCNVQPIIKIQPSPVGAACGSGGERAGW